MKVCPNCKKADIIDEAVFCPACGMTFATQQQAPKANVQPVVNEFDHTADYDDKDISENKLYALMIYVLGAFGVLIAVLKKSDSAYLNFHLKQGIKLLLVYVAASLCSIIPIIGLIPLVVVFVANVICVVDVCNNKAKDVFLIRSIKFLD